MSAPSEPRDLGGGLKEYPRLPSTLLRPKAKWSLTRIIGAGFAVIIAAMILGFIVSAIIAGFLMIGLALVSREVEAVPALGFWACFGAALVLNSLGVAWRGVKTEK